MRPGQTQSGSQPSDSSSQRLRSCTPILTKSQQRVRRGELISVLSHFKPKDATALQYYNFLREFCIMHNCSIDEGIAQADQAWPQLTQRQRSLYASERHAALPIPVPSHLLYRAFQMERDGRWSLGRAPVGDKGATMYTVESYRPPIKHTKMNAKLRANRPKYDNLKGDSAWPRSQSGSSTEPKDKRSETPALVRRVRTLTPPPQRHRIMPTLSLTRILSTESEDEAQQPRQRRRAPSSGGKAKVRARGATKKQHLKQKKQQHQKQKHQQRSSGGGGDGAASGKDSKKKKQQRRSLKLAKGKSKRTLTISHTGWPSPLPGAKGIRRRLVMHHPAA